MRENELVKVERDDPLRCQANIAQGQCNMRRVDVPDAKYCQLHGGKRLLDSAKNNALKMYQLSKFKERIDELTDHSKIKSLREEIGILRVLVETKLNKCNDEHDLMMQSQSLCQLIAQVEKTVVSCHKVENALGAMLDKTQVITFAQELVKIVGNHIQDPDILESIANEVTEAVAAIKSNSPLID